MASYTKTKINVSGQYIENGIKINLVGGSYPAQTRIVIQSGYTSGFTKYVSVTSRNFQVNFTLTDLENMYVYSDKTKPYVSLIFNIERYYDGAWWIMEGEQVSANINITPDRPVFSRIPTYSDTNEDTLEITNDDQILVNGQSKLSISSIFPQAYKHGYIKSIEVNGTNTFAYNSGMIEFRINDFLFNNPNLELSLVAIDSRGWRSDKMIIADASKIRYKANSPKIDTLNIERDGISDVVMFEASGYYLEGYQPNVVDLTTNYKWRDRDYTIIHNGETTLTLTKSPSSAWESYLSIISEYEQPQWATEDNIQYYTGTQWNNGISDLFTAAISYNDKYTQEYLQTDYDSVNDRYRVISGGYNGSWKNFWLDSIKAIYNEMYGNEGMGGNYEWQIEEVAIKGDIASGFSMENDFDVIFNITSLGNTTSQTIYVSTAMPAIDVYKDNIAIHRLYNENLGGTQINGDIYWGNQKLIEDTGWINANLSSSAFQLYTNIDVCQYRRIGNLVQLRGAVKPKNQIAADNVTTIFTLPSGFYNTDRGLYNICQGSGMNRWLLEVTTSGEVRCSRYGTTSNIAIPNTHWLPFAFTFLINDSV